MRRRLAQAVGIVVIAIAGAALAHANVDLELRPLLQTGHTNQIINFGLYAKSNTGANQAFGFVDAVLLWNPNELQLLGKSDDGPYVWSVSGFPDDSGLDGLNEPYTGPQPFVPANDGDAFYQASRAPQPNPPPVATPQGLLVTNFRFRVLVTCGQPVLDLAEMGGPNTYSRVLDAMTPGQDITGMIGGSVSVNVSCSDGVFCNGVEFCQTGTCMRSPPPCPSERPYCIESTDTCAECLGDNQCADGVFCNGVELCQRGTCMAGSDPCPGQFCNEFGLHCYECTRDQDCDDGIACSLDQCYGGQCRHYPDHTLCDDGVFCNGPEVCDLDVGCRPTVNPCHDPASCDESLDTCGACAGPTVVAEGPRYFSITPTSGSNAVFLLITGDPTNQDAACVFKFVLADGSLGDQPVYQTPTQWGSRRVTDFEIRPSTTYRVCASCERGGLSANTEVSTWMLGDGNNDEVVDLDDILCALDGFAGHFNVPAGFCTRFGLDVQGPGCTPDGLIAIDEILTVLSAFSGDPTLSNCQNVCSAGPEP